MDNLTIATIGMGLIILIALAITFLPTPKNRQNAVPVFKPRATIKIKSTFIREDQ